MPPRTLSYFLEGKTPAERALIKAQALSDIVNTGEYVQGVNKTTLTKLAGYDYTLDGVTITIIGASVSGACLTVFATASDANGPLPAPDNNAHRFVNPPISRYTREPDPEIPDDPGETTEDVIAVAQRVLYDSVVTYARNHGWNG